MPHTYTTEALILSRVDRGDFHRVLTVFTPEHGRLQVMAQGVRRPRAKLRGGVEPLTRSELWLARGRVYERLAGARVGQPYQRLRQDHDRLGAAYVVAEAASRVSLESQADQPLFSLLVDTLNYLESSQLPFAPLPFTYLFLWRLLALAGWQAELDRCGVCHSAVGESESLAISASLGGVLHRSELAAVPDALTIDPTAHQLAMEAVAASGSWNAGASSTPLAWSAFGEIVSRWWEQHHQWPLLSLASLRQAVQCSQGWSFFRRSP